MPKKPACEQMLQVLKLVPVGRVVSYGQLADLAGLPGRARLAGRCLRQCEETVPWHRVVRSDGRLAFSAGSEQFTEQRIRLTDEGINVINGRVKMREVVWKPDLYTLLAELSG